MNLASLYSKHNYLQRNDASFVLKNYFQLVQWKKGDKNVIMDIGCGSGEITEDLLLPLVPKPFEKLVGVDISKEMVKFAKTHCKHSKLFFEEMDIEAEAIPIYFQEGFHHVFSFLCFHWIQNQRIYFLHFLIFLAPNLVSSDQSLDSKLVFLQFPNACEYNIFLLGGFRNVLKILKPGGDMLLTMMTYTPVYDVYESLSKNERWKSYMENVDNYLMPYQRSENRETKLSELLKEVGFENVFCKVVDRIYVYPSVADFKNSMIAINPFYKNIPNNLRSAYMSDYMSELGKLNFVKDNNNKERVHPPYKLFIVYAQKPPNN